MKYMLVFFVFYCCLLGCNEPTPNTTAKTTPQEDLSVKDTCGIYNRRGCDSTYLDNPKRLDLLCREIKNFDAKKDLIGKNDSLIYSTKEYKEYFLKAIQKTRRNGYNQKLIKLLCEYKIYGIGFRPFETNWLGFASVLGDFEYIIQNQKIISPTDNCLTGRAVFDISYRHQHFIAEKDAKTCGDVDVPEVTVEIKVLPNETYKITGKSIIWVNGKLNAAKYTKNGEKLIYRRIDFTNYYARKGF
jgi:hypothetical protein